MIKRPEKIAILGAGNGGFAAAADLKQKGFYVTFFEMPQFADTLKEVQEKGGIELETLESSGLKGGFCKIDVITTDPEQAIKGCNVLLVIVPAFAQKYIAKAIAPYLEDGQMIVLNPGNFGGTIEFGQILKNEGVKKDIILAETECLIYACRKKSPSTVWIRGYKNELQIAALPATDNQVVLETMKYLYPTVTSAANVITTGLSNPNSVGHPPIMLLNTGSIDNKKDFLFYWEGLSPAVGVVMEELDKERMYIGSAFNLGLTRKVDTAKRWYSAQGAKGETLHELLGKNPIYQWSKGPDTLQHRYILEDIPYGLVPMEELADLAGTPSPTIKAMIQLGCLVTGKDLRKEGRGLKKLGLGNITLEELKKLVNEKGIMK